MRISFKNIFRVAFFYVILIISFALIYWGVYYTNTSSFYVSEQYNEKVNDWSTQHDSTRVYTIPDRNEIPFTLHDFNQKLKPISDSLIWHYQHRNELKKQYAKMETDLNEYSCLFAELRNKEIKQFRENALKGLKDSIALMEEEIVWIESRKEMDFQLISSKYMEIASLKMELAKRMLRVSSIVLDNYGFFGNRFQGDTILFLNHELVVKSIEMQRNEQEIHCIYDKYVQLTHRFHQNRIEKVGFLDFLHFSTLVATSNSYGDILPNNDWVRFVVTLQLLLGIVYLACILAWIEKKWVK